MELGVIAGALGGFERGAKIGEVVAEAAESAVGVGAFLVVGLVLRLS
jgi:hypothetical protein